MRDHPGFFETARRFRALTADECYDLLRVHYLGRVGFVRDGRPEVLPVNYRLDGLDVVCRVGESLAAALPGQIVAFEVDEVDLAYQSGRSVVVHGAAEHVSAPADLRRVSSLPLRPWAPGTRLDFIRIIAHDVTGRRLG